VLELVVEQDAQLLPQVLQVLDCKTNVPKQLKQLELEFPLQVKHKLSQAAQLPFIKYFPLAQLVQTLALLHPAQLELQLAQVVTVLTAAE